MSDTSSKETLPHQTPYSKSHCTGGRKASVKSDPEERKTSDIDTRHKSSDDLSIIALYDDLVRFIDQRSSSNIEEAFLGFSENTKFICSQWRIAITECKRLQTLLDGKTHEFSDMERKLMFARKLLDQEMKKTRSALLERDNLKNQIQKVHGLLFKDNWIKFDDQAREQLAFLCKARHTQEVVTSDNIFTTSSDVNSTDSLLSDMSISHLEDDLNNSKYLRVTEQNGWRKHRVSLKASEGPTIKRRRSSTNKVIEIGNTDIVRAVTTVTVTKEGPMTVTSKIELIPVGNAGISPSKGYVKLQPVALPVNLISEFCNRKNIQRLETDDLRRHCFQQKLIVMPELCIACERKIRFGHSALKCKDCRLICHLVCKDYLSLPCIPVVSTPGQRNLKGIVSDYTPTKSPMVPALIVHCLREVEQRGLKEIGLYRISGSERDVKCLKEKFFCGNGSPSLKEVDIHVICSCVKYFLRSLTNPLITYALWKDFVQAVEAKDPQDITLALFQAISKLPQPNRDTLAYVMVHLQKIADSPECKMPIENLARVFGPTIIGYSSDDPNQKNVLNETMKQILVMEQLMKLPSNYWLSFLNIQFSTSREIAADS